MGLKFRRAARVAIVAAGVALANNCVHSASVSCGPDNVCAEGAECRHLTTYDGYACVADGQEEPCVGRADGSPCIFAGAGGTCVDRVCIPARCGDRIIDVSETCDDGNVVDGDDCPATCRIGCGDHVIDLSTGEQCDDGSQTTSGDGCSAHCLREYALWRDVTPTSPLARGSFGLTADPRRGALMIGGGGLSGSGAMMAAFAETWRTDGVTWLEQRPLSVPPRRAAPALAWDPGRKRVVLFGGYNQSGAPQSDTWEYDGVRWLERTVPVASRPPARAGASLACEPSKCLLFGGAGGGSGYRRDAWIWDGVTWGEAPGSNTTPPARAHGALAYDTMRKIYVMYGGTNGSAMLMSDSAIYNGTSWISNSGSGGPLPGAELPAMAWEDITKQVILVANGTTHRFDSLMVTWVGFMSAPNASQLSIAWDFAAHRMIAVGLIANQLVTSSSTQGPWTAATNLDPRPVGSALHIAAAYAPSRGVTIVLDDPSAGSPYGGTYEWNGVGWRQTQPTGSSPERSGVAIAHHLACDVTISLGGGNLGASVGEAWIYRAGPNDTFVWTPIAPGPARTRHSLVYDAKRRAVLAFGGAVNQTTASDELWELVDDGQCGGWQWREIDTGTTRPPARISAGMAYDSDRGVTVLFGGKTLSMAASEFGDTWEWDGMAWTEVSSGAASGSPTPRSEVGMTYDPRGRRIVMFGGNTADGHVAETWVWDAASRAWRALAPAVVPLAHSGVALAPDVTGGIVAINGDGPSNVVALGVLRLTSELSSEPSESCADASLDLDGDTLKGCEDPDCWTRCAPMCAPGASCMAAPRCGDSTCNPDLETFLSCPADCSLPP